MEQLQHYFSCLTMDHNTALLVIAGICLLVIFTLLHHLLSKSVKHSEVEWYDLITDKQDHISLTKVLNLMGGIIGSWVVVKLTLQDKLTWDIFIVYLSYCASIEGFSKYLSAKYNNSHNS